jgi:hypothetical protein
MKETERVSDVSIASNGGCCDHGKASQVEANILWRKYKEAPHMAVAKEPISQPSLEMSPIWTTLINEEVSKLQ